ncbi:unnamed protein product, partial [Sphacelaria rigidula]
MSLIFRLKAPPASTEVHSGHPVPKVLPPQYSSRLSDLPTCFLKAPSRSRNGKACAYVLWRYRSGYCSHTTSRPPGMWRTEITGPLRLPQKRCCTGQKNVAGRFTLSLTSILGVPYVTTNVGLVKDSA